MLGMQEARHTVMQGNIGLGMAISYFTLSGHVVSLPLNDCQNYDLIVEIDGCLKKIQVKTTRAIRYNNYVVQLKSVRHNKTENKIHGFDGSQIDYLFVVTESNEQYLIPTDENTPKSSLTLGDDYQQYRVN